MIRFYPHFLPIFALLVTACGVSPEQAADGLEEMLADSTWCGWKPEPPQVDVEKSFNHPDNYGIDGTFYTCYYGQQKWLGGYCYAPDSKTQTVRLYKDTQDDAWFKKSTDRFGVVQNRMNGLDWTVTRISTGTPKIEVRTGTTDPTGYLGTAVSSGWTAYAGFSRGTYYTYSHCVASLFRTSIEANWAYQAASDSQRAKYLKNLWDHEMNHCLGLGHVDSFNELMSVNYGYPGPYFDGVVEPTDIQENAFYEFDPI